MQLNNSVICTLFEGHYHYGFAALVNSLYKNGFRGNIYAGYRGSLPEWAKGASEDNSLDWNGASILVVNSSLSIHFLPVLTEWHFTNYKPDFLIQLLKQDIDISAIFYFDPDIVIKCEWDFFNHWVSCGVAVVHEIMYNDMPATHPLRNKWTSVIKEANKKVERHLGSYVNGGFCGITSENILFLNYWSEFIHIGSTKYNVDLKKISDNSKTHAYCFIDQDALNMALMCYPGDISEVGPDGMDFTNGGYVMSHFTGYLKPWKKSYLKNALLGMVPTLSENLYWENSNGIIKTHSELYVSIKIITLKLARFISRFYHKK